MAGCNWGLKAGVAGQKVITPTLSWQLRTGVPAQIKCSFLFSFWGSQVQQKQALQPEINFNVGMFGGVNDLQGKDHMYSISAG